MTFEVLRNTELDDKMSTNEVALIWSKIFIFSTIQNDVMNKILIYIQEGNSRAQLNFSVPRKIYLHYVLAVET